MDSVVIANHGAGEVKLPLYVNRDGKNRLVELIPIAGGKTSLVNSQKWDRIKTNKQVQAMINSGFLSEVRTAKKENEDVPTFARPLDELPVPEELLQPQEVPQAGTSDVSAKITKRQHRTITVE